MGGAATAVSNSANEIYANPAGLARMRNPRSRNVVHEFGAPGFQLGGNLLALQGIDAALTSDTEAPTSIEGTRDVSEDYFESDRFGRVLGRAVNNPGKPLYAETQLHTYLVLGAKAAPTWYVGIPVRSELTLGVPSLTDTSLVYIHSRTTTGLSVGMSDMSNRGLISWGLMVRPNYRYSYETESWPSTSTAFSKFRKTVTAEADKTTGFPVDVGFQLMAPDLWFPTLGVSVRNLPSKCVANYHNPVTDKRYTVCGSSRSGTLNADNAADQIDPTEIRAGISILPRFRVGRSLLNLRLAADMYPLPIKSGNKSYGFSDLSINDMLHAGFEVFFGHAYYDHIVAVRGGVHGVDFTFGASITLVGFELAYSTYPGYALIAGGSEDKDRRHLLALTTRW